MPSRGPTAMAEESVKALHQLRAPRQIWHHPANSFACSNRSSLLKTARPFRSDPHCCGRGVVVCGPGNLQSTNQPIVLLPLICNPDLHYGVTIAPIVEP